MSNMQVTCRGKVLEAKTATFKDDAGNQQTYGKIQLLVPDASGEFNAIQNVKVRKEHFGWIPDVAAIKGKEVLLELEMNDYNGKISYYLASGISAKAA